jgi:branched-chain amino acid transport system substrate-binding protein
MLMACGAAQAQVSDNAGKIGVLTDHSGGFAYLVGKHSVEATQMAVDDFGGKVLGADHRRHGRSSEQGGHCVGHQPQMVRHRKCRHHHRRRRLGRCSGDAGNRASRGKVLLISGSDHRTDRKGLFETTSQWSYDTYSLAKGTGDRSPSRR